MARRQGPTDEDDVGGESLATRQARLAEAAEEEAAVETLELFTAFDEPRHGRDHFVDGKRPSLRLHLCGHQLDIAQDGSLQMRLGITGARVWDAAVILARFLEHRARDIGVGPGSTCLELGAGCGVTGMAAALLGCRTWITDQDDMVPFLSKNVADNLSGIPTASEAVRVESFTWGEELCPELTAEVPFDLVLCADVAYNEHDLPVLIDALQRPCGRDTIILFALELRSPAVFEEFLRLALPIFDVARVPPETWHPEVRCASVVIYAMRLKQVVSSAAPVALDAVLGYRLEPYPS